MTRFHLILTLDYELFGDGSGCVDACLVQPTEQARQIIEGYDGRLTLFVEALEMQKLQELVPGDFAGVDRQLGQMAAKGHPLELHLHPQWMTAARETENWHLDFSKWRIGDLSPAEQAQCVDAGISFLNNYGSVHAFRAGAWAIQPEASLLELLRERGISLESSVAPGIHNPAAGDWFDFRQVPDAPYWFTSDNVCRQQPGGRTLEVPITTQAIGRLPHFRAIAAARRMKRFPEGCEGSYDGPNSRLQSLRGKLAKLYNLGQVMLDFSTLPAELLIAVVQGAMVAYESEGGAIPLVAIGHNKNFSRNSAIELDKFLAWVATQPEICLSDYRSWREQLALTGTDYAGAGLG